MVEEKSILSAINNFIIMPEGENKRCLCQFSQLSADPATSNYKEEKVVYLFAGPSGSGKTTLMANFYSRGIFGRPNGLIIPFVNRNFTLINGSQVKLTSIAEEISYKRKLMKKNISFVMETASLNNEYLDFLREIKNNGYKICMFYVTKKNPHENELCAEIRKRQGGHALDKHRDGIEGMYLTNGVSLRRAITFCDSVYVIDNRTKTADHSDSKPIMLIKKDQRSGMVYMMHPNNDELQREYHGIIKPKAKRKIKIKPSRCGVKSINRSMIYTGKLRSRITITDIPEGYVQSPTGNYFNKKTGDIILAGEISKKPKK